MINCRQLFHISAAPARHPCSVGPANEFSNFTDFFFFIKLNYIFMVKDINLLEVRIAGTLKRQEHVGGAGGGSVGEKL